MKIYECSYSNHLLLWREIFTRARHPLEPQPSGIRAWFAMLMAKFMQEG